MTTARLRCAVYTRKSTEEGLEQEFNSLDAQREACAAYIASQRHEGWVPVKQHYDDGGFSGGNMSRPGLQQLLAEVEAGRVDVIVVYKVDRLTRSLADFAKIVEVLDAKSASFVSITQSFNTTTSMGRLTLNVLLSFAQFEREVTGERIRDKIAASKKKGLWMGGPVPLGYEVRERKLVVNEEEAERVRNIMRHYLDAPSVNALIGTLREGGIITKIQNSVSGPHRGGIPFARGSLFHLLKNRIYLGMIVHKGEAYPGEHEAIVDQQLWEAVQAKLQRKAPPRTTERNGRQQAMLRGLLFDHHGRPMVVTHAKKGNRRYRYYASSRTPDDEVAVVRVGLDACENTVVDQLGAFLLNEPELQRAFHIDDASELASALRCASELASALRCASELAKKLGDPIERLHAVQSLLLKAEFDGDTIHLHIDQAALCNDPDNVDHQPIKVTVPFRAKRWSRETRMAFGTEKPSSPTATGAGLLALIGEARQAQAMVFASPDLSLSALATREGCSRRQFNRLIKLSYLSPRIVEAIVDGRVPDRLTRTRLLEMPLPLDWREQERAIGLQ